MPISTACFLIENASLLEQLFQRVSVHELHPESDMFADALGAVDADHVGMANSSQQTTLFDDRGGARVARGWTGRQKLERHLAIEPRVPGAVDPPERAAADAFQHAEVSPVLLLDEWVGGGLSRNGRGARSWRKSAVQVGNRRDYSQGLEQRAVDLLGTRLGRRPVDWGPVEDRAGDVRKHTAMAWHLVLLTP